MSKLSLSVQASAESGAVIRSKADLNDQRWLNQQVNALRDGIEAARDIWLNWTENRNVGRLHPGQSAGDFIAARLGGVRLDLPRLIAAVPDLSNREIAKVAGVSHQTVMRARGGPSGPPESEVEPTRVIGADGKSYPGRVVGTTTAEVIEAEDREPVDPEALAALIRAVEAITTLARQKPGDVGTAIAPKDRPRRWREIRRAAAFLGQVALAIEGEREQ